MAKANEKLVCNPQPDQLDTIRRWVDALEGCNRELAYELMNQVMDGKISYQKALALLDNKPAKASPTINKY